MHLLPGFALAQQIMVCLQADEVEGAPLLPSATAVPPSWPSILAMVKSEVCKQKFLLVLTRHVAIETCLSSQDWRSVLLCIVLLQQRPIANISCACFACLYCAATCDAWHDLEQDRQSHIQVWHSAHDIAGVRNRLL